MRSIDRIALGCVAALLSAAPAAAQIIVVRAQGPSAARFKPGSVIPATAPVALKAGDVLTLLDQSGSWTLRGPRSLPPKAQMQPAAAPKILAVNDRRARIGAVRRPLSDGSRRPNIWLLDVRQPGPVCYVDAAAPTLWRADTKAPATLAISGPNGEAQVSWAAGQDTADWPASLPPTPGASYKLAAGAGKPVTVVLKPLAVAPADPAQTGQALIAAGCQPQLDLLVAEMGTPDSGS